MWDVRACRSCLAVKGKLEKIGDAFKRQYTAITGLQISDDGYPTYFCMECRHHLKKSLAFRRKSRRAHFVLKEIMAVRKQISYSDILTVNRRKTNLESSLNYWEPNNNACYLIANREGQEGQEAPEDDGLRKYSLEVLPLNYTKTYSTHLVDIEPEVVEPEIVEPEPVETEPVETNEQKELDDNGFNEEDIPTNDYLDTDIDTTNIDMNDIFKDLEEQEQPEDNDDGIEELKLPEKVKTYRPRKMRDDLARIRIAVKSLVEILRTYNLRVLSVEEQKERFEVRKSEAPFVHAPFKCAVCLTVHSSMNELTQHVKFHNDRKFDFECKVCKNKLPCADDLNAHVANYHMYEYSCKRCDTKLYSQAEAIRHSKRDHANQQRVRRKRPVATVLKTFTITPLTQEMMREAMKLGSRANELRGVESDYGNVQSKYGRAKCDICGLWMNTRDDLEKHMTLKHRFMYTCKLCKEVFTTRIQALDHGDTHDSLWECIQCGKEFDDAVKLRRHRKGAHFHKKVTPCNLCGHTANSDQLFYRHQLSQHGYISLNDELTGDPQYQCEECCVQFMDQRSLEQHLISMNHKGANTVELACIPCKKVFGDAEQLDTHYITCLYSNKYPRNCCYCPEVLNSPLEYKCHYYQQHPTLPYRYIRNNCICDVCGKSVFKPQLEAHLKTHSSDCYACRHCSFSTTSSARYIGHVINWHLPRPYLCTLCPQKFKSRSNLKRHVLKVHAPTKLYKCDFCGKEFSYFDSLRQHSKTLHDVILPSVKPAIKLNSRRKIYVYPHMRIEINELERPVVEKTAIELVDYLEYKSKPVDYQNYFVFNPDIEENVCIIAKNNKKRVRRRKKQTELETAVANIKYETNIEPSDCKEIKGENVEMEMDSQMVEMEVENLELNNVEKVESVEAEKVESTVEAEKVESRVEAEFEVDAMGLDEGALPLEVIESDGHQYVMIDGEMYRIACEDEI